MFQAKVTFSAWNGNIPQQSYVPHTRAPRIFPWGGGGVEPEAVSNLCLILKITL
jgi:hypothetical protein